MVAKFNAKLFFFAGMDSELKLKQWGMSILVSLAVQSTPLLREAR